MGKKNIHIRSRDFVYNPNRDLYEGSYIIAIEESELSDGSTAFECVDTLPAGVIYQRHDVLLKNKREEVSNNPMPACSLSLMKEANRQRLVFSFSFAKETEKLQDGDRIILAVYVIITEYESFEEKANKKIINRVELPKSDKVALSASAMIISPKTLRSDISKRLRTHLHPYWSTRASTSTSMDIEYLITVGTGKHDMRNVKVYDAVPQRGDAKGSVRTLVLCGVDMSDVSLLGYKFKLYYSESETPKESDYVSSEMWNADLSAVKAYMIDFGDQIIRKNIRLHFIVTMRAKDKSRYFKWDKVISSAHYESEIYDDRTERFNYAGKRETNTARLSITEPECLIGNIVFHDKNKNGIRDEDENGVPFQKVSLYRKCGKGKLKIRGESYSLSDSQQTSLGGRYVFRVKKNGVYVVRVELGGGYKEFSDIKTENKNQNRDVNSFDKKGYSSEIHVNFSEHGYKDIENFCVDAGVYW